MEGRVVDVNPCMRVGPGGTFELQEYPGENTLVVFDVATRVLLYRGEVVQVQPGKERTVDIAVDARPVELRFRSQNLDGPASGFVELRPEPGFWPTNLGGTLGPGEDNASCGMGIDVPWNRSPVRVWLPRCAVRARLWIPRPTDADAMTAEQTIEPARGAGDPVVFGL